MNSIANRLITLNVPQGSLAVCFIGQAGVIIKTPAGELAGIDLYLSDCCNRFFGFKRLMPKLLSPDELEFDFVISTHAHYDHFDPDSIPPLLEPEKLVLSARSTAKKSAKSWVFRKTNVYGLKSSARCVPAACI